MAKNEAEPYAETPAQPKVEQIEIAGTETKKTPISIDNPMVLELRSPEVARIVEMAFLEREARLKTLAKNNSEGGYPREADVQNADRSILKNELMSQLNMQMQFKGATAVNIVDICTQVIGRHVRDSLKQRLIQDAIDTEQKKGNELTRAKALEEVTQALELFEDYVGTVAELAGAAVVPLLTGLYQDAFTRGRLQYGVTAESVLQALADKLMQGNLNE